ncbi:MAG: hypothetical protein GXP45_04230 [bacterium]|nr:hypothetical protein [bacterium]
MTTTKRYPHIRRRADFYGPIIYGDDAAVLDTRKQLEIRNDSSFPIYYKLMTFPDYTYLVAILPINPHKQVEIQKISLGNLRAELHKIVTKFSKQDISHSQNFFSRYYQYFK